jgi:imidazole glycerol phosphate synthase glutamine amidotransferase subunit
VITVVDYGMGNLRNVRRALETIGCGVQISGDPAVVAAAGKILLPGVGAFGEAVRHIDALGLREPLLRHSRAGRPLLGICLGMQLLFESSEESPGAAGLGLFPGRVMKFAEGRKIPHIGWNDVVPERPSRLLAGGAVCCYFVHSYYVEVTEVTVAVTEYGTRFSSGVAAGNVFGFQFHPEKSQDAGLKMLKAFAEIE